MLGKRTNPELSAKAAETVGLLDFAVELCRDHGHLFPNNQGELLYASGKAALDFNRIMREAPRVLSRGQQEAMMTTYLRFTALFDRAGGKLTPKFHLMIHLIQQCGVRGNPRFYPTYRDESINGVIAKLARSSHRSTFADTVHAKFGVLQKLQPAGLGMF